MRLLAPCLMGQEGTMSTDYRGLLEQFKSQPDYWARLACRDFVDGIERLLHDKGLSRTELARLLDVSPARVTQVLRGDGNLTLAVLCNFAAALGGAVHLHVERKEIRGRWVSYEPERKTAHESMVDAKAEFSGTILKPRPATVATGQHTVERREAVAG
jgi:transcriptional regulator with XRE-family HTH domain